MIKRNFIKIIFLLTFLLIIPISIAVEYTLFIDASDDQGISIIEAFIQSPSDKIISFVLYNFSQSQKIETNLHFEKKIFLNENGRYKWWAVIKDLSGNLNKPNEQYVDNYDIHQRMKNEFKLDFNYIIWDFYLELINPEKPREINTISMSFSLPISENYVRINEEDPEELIIQDTATDRIFKIKDRLNIGKNIIQYHLEIPKEAIKGNYKQPIKILTYDFHIFPLDEYVFEKTIPTINPEGMIADEVIVKILKIPDPYLIDLDNSGLINRLPEIKISTNVTYPKIGDVVNITGQYTKEVPIKKFKFINDEYVITSAFSELHSPLIKVKFITSKKYREVVYIQLSILFFFIGVGFIYLFNDRKLLLKDNIDKILLKWFFDKIPILGEKVFNYWVKTGILMMGIFISLRGWLLDNIDIPYRTLNADYTFLDIETWTFIAICYIIFFWVMDYLPEVTKSSS